MARPLPNNLGPYLPPYDPRTMPYYIDLFYDHFKGRPFPVSGSYGFTGNQVDTTGQNIQLLNSASQGAITMTLKSGQGSYFTPGEIIVAGDGNTNWQPFQVNSISTDTLTVFPRVAPAAGWPANTNVQHAWGNSSHPSYTYAWFGYSWSIANAKMRRCDGQPSILPPNGAGTGHDLGSMLDGSTIGGLANCPAGWQPVGTAANVTCTPTSYGVTSLSLNGRGGNNSGAAGTALQASTASGSGISTSVNIPVTPGKDYTLSMMTKTNAGNGFKVQVNDSTTTTTVLQTYTWNTTNSDYNGDNLCTRTTLQFTVPGGTTGIQIQLISQLATDNTYFSDLRLVESRQSPLYDRYVIESPGNRPIVVLGDSWTFQIAQITPTPPLTLMLQARLGESTQVVYAGTTGITVAQMVANMASQVLPFNPAYCILGTGMQNDLAQNLSQSSVQSSLASFIDTCRVNGIIPVILGVAPTSNTAVTGETSPLQWAHDLNEACRTQCFSVTK